MQSNNIVQKSKTAEELTETIEKFENKPECVGRFWANEGGYHLMFFKDSKGQIQIQICKDEQPIATVTTQRHHAAEIGLIFGQVANEYANRHRK